MSTYIVNVNGREMLALEATGMDVTQDGDVILYGEKNEEIAYVCNPIWVYKQSTRMEDK